MILQDHFTKVKELAITFKYIGLQELKFEEKKTHAFMNIQRRINNL